MQAVHKYAKRKKRDESDDFKVSRKTLNGMELLSAEFLSEFLGVTKQCLALWREANLGPEYIRISPKMIRYPKKSVLSWLEQNHVETYPTLADAVISAKAKTDHNHAIS